MNDEITLPTPGRQVSPVLIQLLKGVVYQERHPALWQDFLTFQGPVRNYFSAIGLEVLLDEAEGFAFLRQAETSLGQEQDETQVETALPRLISRRPMGYPLSLLCVLLRKKLAEFDARGGATRLVLSQAQIVEMMHIYMPPQKNEARTVDVINTTIKKTMELGFLKKLGSDDHQYEVGRIIKALVDADWLKKLDTLLDEYMEYANKDD